ncbi:hypothetical protein F503_03270 [Ophiostoma piceae UAMH 11346]|uniref:Aminoglycoside phosphotransferase domain-containing protein n=1 Tax=Ophiostoma piceae (strain UAMH 11346) TaxID=1262450 RepID=S3CK54_OPHP1|nr:hypothetical protein F503_03270 [Ophiostoma piceae UAMH 11346]
MFWHGIWRMHVNSSNIASIPPQTPVGDMALLFRRLFRFIGDWLSFCRPNSFRNTLAWLHSYLINSGDSAAAPKLSRHMQYLQEIDQDLKERHYMPDNFPPTLTSEDGPLLVSWTTKGVSHYFTTKTKIKREPHKDEMGLDVYGVPVVIPYITDRIQIEAANLEFIAADTAIPVPKVLGLWQEHGLWYVKTALVEGAVELKCVDKDKMPAAVAAVEDQLQNDILPQLRRLRRSFMGCADPNLPVVPPHRFWESKDKRIWSSMPKGDDEEPYTFCHTDLGPQNIMVDPDTFRIISIIDWETSGFFPSGWELPYWRTGTHQERYQMTIAAMTAECGMIEAKEAEV